MRLHVTLTLGLLLICISCASAKDDITKELITSNGKTRKFNQTAWQFLKKYELEGDPFYQKYNWNE